MKVAFVFPGQGSQYVGMGKDLWENSADVKSLYEEADNTLGYDLKDLSFNGPREELNKTFRTQPCLLTASMAAFTVLASKGIRPDVVAGHSLGEYSALVSAGVVSFRDALILTEKRGALMQEAVPEGDGLMAAIVGLGRGRIDEICLSVESGYVAPANYNCPGQVVIAGEKRAVEEAMKLARDAGAKRAVALAVSAPSHCTLMVEASNGLAELLKTVRFTAPDMPVVNNADAMFLASAERIKLSLVNQLNSPLLWEDSIRTIIGAGVDTFIEVGPGRILIGLIKRIDPSVKLLHVQDMASLGKTVEEMQVS
jgi:[acyl-carrier-protein] S-malonyltransferase